MTEKVMGSDGKMYGPGERAPLPKGDAPRSAKGQNSGAVEGAKDVERGKVEGDMMIMAGRSNGKLVVEKRVGGRVIQTDKPQNLREFELVIRRVQPSLGDALVKEVLRAGRCERAPEPVPDGDWMVASPPWLSGSSGELG